MLVKHSTEAVFYTHTYTILLTSHHSHLHHLMLAQSHIVRDLGLTLILLYPVIIYTILFCDHLLLDSHSLKGMYRKYNKIGHRFFLFKSPQILSSLRVFMQFHLHAVLFICNFINTVVTFYF